MATLLFERNRDDGMPHSAEKRGIGMPHMAKSETGQEQGAGNRK